MLAFLAFDWVVILLILGGIGLIWAVEAAISGLALIILVGILAVAGFSHPEVFHYIKDNPLPAVGWVLGYIAAGMGWSFIKWIGYVRKELRRVLERNKGNEEYFRSRQNTDIIPQAKDHKGDIVFWMTYWVPSLVGTILHDWIIDLFNTLFEYVRDLYQALANWVFSGVIKDLERARNAKERSLD